MQQVRAGPRLVLPLLALQQPRSTAAAATATAASRSLLAVQQIRSFRTVTVASSAAAAAAAASSSSSGRRWQTAALSALLATTAAAAAAATAQLESKEQPQQQQQQQDEADGDGKKTFREGKIAAYEDRLRLMSSPDKVFRYFATVRIDGVVYMRPEDFVRAVVGHELQPKGLGLDLYEDVKACPEKSDPKFGGTFEHDKTGKLVNSECGYITYPDFLFLLTVLSSARRQFELAFKMFDEDGNGYVDLQEFLMIQRAVQKTAVGARQASTAPLEHSVLLKRFFGKDGKKTLDFKHFAKFADELQRNILHLEFLAHNTDMADRNVISPYGLTKLLLKKARISPTNRQEYLARVQAKFPEGEVAKQNLISFEETATFFQFLRATEDFSTALHIFHAAGVGIEQKDFERAAKAVGFPMPERIVQLIFTIFDSNGDGQLDESEFLKIMKDARSPNYKPASLSVKRGINAIVDGVRQKMDNKMQS